jgi:tripartite-type tricarboxylate transporter receptor subunit TctC
VIKTGTPDEFAKFVKAEELRWRAVIKSANIAPE